MSTFFLQCVIQLHLSHILLKYLRYLIKIRYLQFIASSKQHLLSEFNMEILLVVACHYFPSGDHHYRCDSVKILSRLIGYEAAIFCSVLAHRTTVSLYKSRILPCITYSAQGNKSENWMKYGSWMYSCIRYEIRKLRKLRNLTFQLDMPPSFSTFLHLQNLCMFFPIIL